MLLRLAKENTAGKINRKKKEIFVRDSSVVFTSRACTTVDWCYTNASDIIVLSYKSSV